MGKGDQRTKRGKIIRGSYGKTRLRKPATTESVEAPVAEVKEEPKVAEKKAKKAPAKKAEE